jgi:hypothetical protein
MSTRCKGAVCPNPVKPPHLLTCLLPEEGGGHLDVYWAPVQDVEGL